LKTLVHPFFWIYVFAFLINQTIENFGAPIPFIHSYFDDFLFVPLFLFGFKFLVSAYVLHNENYNVPVVLVVLSVVVFSTYFEILHEITFLQNTPDYYDIIAYAAGGCCFYLFFNS